MDVRMDVRMNVDGCGCMWMGGWMPHLQASRDSNPSLRRTCAGVPAKRGPEDDLGRPAEETLRMLLSLRINWIDGIHDLVFDLDDS